MASHFLFLITGIYVHDDGMLHSSLTISPVYVPFQSVSSGLSNSHSPCSLYPATVHYRRKDDKEKGSWKKCLLIRRVLLRDVANLMNAGMKKNRNHKGRRSAHRKKILH